MNRIFVEKQPAFNAEARHLLHDLRESLGLAGLQAVHPGGQAGLGLAEAKAEDDEA